MNISGYLYKTMADNSGISAKLAEMAEMHERLGNEYKALAYSRASGTVLESPRITRANVESMKIPGVGDGIRSKIIEYLETGMIAELEKNRAETAARAVLEPIIGVGPVTAGKWIDAGIETVEALREAAAAGKVKLTNMQTLGLKYYDDLTTRIPRAEVTEIVIKIGACITAADPSAVVTCAGSYRRGAEDSGDIDIITCNRAAPVPDFIARVAEKVRRVAEFVADLSEGAERYTFLYRGARVRQVDILYIKPAEYPAALLYFTGSWDFNEAMRGHAKGLGYKLNQHGLYGPDGVIPAASEEDIFAALGLRYVVPGLRRGPADVEPV